MTFLFIKLIKGSFFTDKNQLFTFPIKRTCFPNEIMDKINFNPAKQDKVIKGASKTLEESSPIKTLPTPGY